MEEKKEMVNHPSHYNKEGRKECIDEMVDIFGLENTIIWAIITVYKYRYRIGAKDPVSQEMRKIIWYEEWVEKHIGEFADMLMVYDVWQKYKCFQVFENQKKLKEIENDNTKI